MLKEARALPQAGAHGRCWRRDSLNSELLTALLSVTGQSQSRESRRCYSLLLHRVLSSPCSRAPARSTHQRRGTSVHIGAAEQSSSCWQQASRSLEQPARSSRAQDRFRIRTTVCVPRLSENIPRTFISRQSREVHSLSQLQNHVCVSRNQRIFLERSFLDKGSRREG